METKYALGFELGQVCGVEIERPPFCWSLEQALIDTYTELAHFMLLFRQNEQTDPPVSPTLQLVKPCLILDLFAHGWVHDECAHNHAWKQIPKDLGTNSD